jgi:tRNA-dihydrouridine synthase
MANPWIFRQIEDAMHGRPIFEPTLADKRAILHEYFEAIESGRPYYGEAGAPIESQMNTEITDCNFFTSNPS